MIEHPCAKINLGLNIVSKRSDGYHNLETVFYPVMLNDQIEIELSGEADRPFSDCEITIEGLDIEGNPQDNLIVKAYRILNDRYGALPSVRVRLKKNIPTQAGLGGGSADCAYTIRMLDSIFKLNISQADMITLAAEMGADCAFFISPVPAFASGIGDKLYPVSLDLTRYDIVIVKPDVKISTKEAFANIAPKQPDKCCRDVVKQPVETWREDLFNDFEPSVFSAYPCIADIKDKLYRRGAVYASMSGSGSAVFGIFDYVPEGMKEDFKDCFYSVIRKTSDNIPCL